VKSGFFTNNVPRLLRRQSEQHFLCYRSEAMGERLRVETSVLKVTLLAATCILVGCHTRDADEGSIRVKAAQVIGVYETKFDNGSERLELKSDGTYVQDFISKSRPFHHAGQWHIENLLLDGSEVVLANAASSEGDEGRPLSFSDLPLYTHDRSGKVGLARNEVADWYYERGAQ
jgi:hypothetical protein